MSHAGSWYELPNAPAPGTVLAVRNDLPDGTPTMLAAGADTPDAKAFRYLLLRSGDAVHGFVNRCAHFGVPLAERQEQLIYQPHVSLSCNVHYARYRWHDGVCIAGDCVGESLMALPVRVEGDGLVRVDAPAGQSQ